MRTFIFLIILTITQGVDCFGQVLVPNEKGNLTSQKEESKKIIVYGSDSCHYCIDTKAYLKEKKIDFVYYDVDINLLKQKEMLIKLQKGGIPVDNLYLPVIDFNGKLLMNSIDFKSFLEKLDNLKTKSK